jgi:hypothetical protein
MVLQCINGVGSNPVEANLYKLSLILIDTEEGHLLIENFVNIFFVTPLSVLLHNLLDLIFDSSKI